MFIVWKVLHEIRTSNKISRTNTFLCIFLYFQHVVFEFISSFPLTLLLVARFLISIELFWKKRPEEYHSCRIAYVDRPWEQSQKDLWLFLRFVYNSNKKIQKKNGLPQKIYDRLLFSDTKEYRNPAQKKKLKINCCQLYVPFCMRRNFQLPGSTTAAFICLLY